MATKIKIGHASISEHGTVNGTAGDSTGREVYVNADFSITSLQPNVVLRPKTKALADASVAACIAGCENNNIGYSQSSRNTLYNLAKANGYDLSKVGSCNTDCSAFMTVCAIAGGSRIAYGSNAPTTTNMRTRFKQSGDYSVLTDSKHLTMTDYLKRGDILVCEGSHTVMVLENGISAPDDLDSGSGGSSLITPITNIRVRYIDTTITSIDTTKASVAVKVVERKAGVADKLLSANTVKGYTWSYTLEAMNGSSTKTKQLTLTSSKGEISLTGLKAATTYTIQIFATKNGSIEFCSSKVLFTTLSNAKAPEMPKQQFTCKDSNTIDKIYIKVNNEHKPAILHINKELK